MFKATGLELTSSLNGRQDSLGSSRTHRFFSMIAAGVVWHPNGSFTLVACFDLPFSLVRMFRIRAKLAFSPSLMYRQRLAAGGSRAKFCLRPSKSLTQGFNLLMDPNAVQFVR